MDIASKSTGDSMTAAEQNQVTNEIENTLTSTGQTPSSVDVFQLAKGTADYSAHGDFYTDSGSASTYVLAAQGSKQPPTAYVAGFRARFVVGNSNTGASTINIATLGVKNIKRRDGSATQADDLVVSKIATVEYDGTDFILDQQDFGIIQQVNVQDSAVATGSTQIPSDDTIPQNTEGDEYITLAITPTLATNKLVIEFIGYFSHSGVGGVVAAALFKDADANSLAAGWGSKATTSNQEAVVPIRYEMVAGSTSAITFKIRAGGDVAGTLTLNGNSGVRRYGGVMASHLTITEVKL